MKDDELLVAVRWAFLAAGLAACTPPDPVYGPIEAFAEVPELPTGALEFLSGDLEIPPRSETLMCTMFTYDGPTVGVNTALSYQDEHYGHHAFLLETLLTESQQPDGEIFDCTSAEDFSMAQTETFYVPKPEGLGRTGMRLPEGMAVKLESGKRLLLQSHYVNYEYDPLIARAAVHLMVEDAADVQTWAAPFAHTSLDIDIPAGAQDVELTIDCGWEQDANVLFLIGHMHEHGDAFQVDHTLASGGESTIYDASPWLRSYRDKPPVEEYAPGEMVVHAGDRFRTTCRWDNDGDEDLSFPHEMCATVGIAYPAEDKLYCASF